MEYFPHTIPLIQFNCRLSKTTPAYKNGNQTEEYTMDFEQVGNSDSAASMNEPPELLELDIEFAALAEDFNLEEASGSGSTSELDLLIAGTELEPDGSESTGGTTNLLDLADQIGTGSDPEFLGKITSAIGGAFSSAWGGFVKGKAARLIRKLISLVRKAPKYASCVPQVLAAAAAFKAQKWGTALRLAYRAYKCIKSKS